MAEQTIRVNLDTKGFDRSLGRIQAGLAGLVGIATIKSVAQLSDTFQQVNARLRLVTKGTEQFNRTQAALNKLAKDTRSGLVETTDLFARFARSVGDTGASTEELLITTQAVNQAIKVSGASAQEANAAIIQLGQGLASGALRGDELRSVLEQTPRLARAIADGLGVTIGQLRTIGTEGGLTTDVVLKAIQSQAGKIAAEYALIPPTIADAFTELQNQVLRSTEELNRVGFGAVLTGIAEALGDIVSAAAMTIRDLFPQKDLNQLAKRIKVTILDSVIAVLKGFDALVPAISPIFTFLKTAFNNLIGFFNALPPGVQTLGIIGFILIGRTGKLLVLLVSAIATEIARIMDFLVSRLYDAQNLMIKGINKVRSFLNFDPIPLVEYDPTMLQDMLTDIGVTGDLFESNANKLEKMEGSFKEQDSTLKSMITNLTALKNASNAPDFVKGIVAKSTVAGTVKPVESQKELDKQKEALEKRFLQLSQSLYTETQALQVDYEKKLTLLEDYYMQTEMADRDYYRIKEKLEKKHQDNLAKISARKISEQVDLLKNGEMQKIDLTKLSTEEITQFTKDGAMEVFKIAAGQNKKIFEAYKAYQIANGIISTTSAVLNVLGNPAIPFPLNIAAAGVIGAMGAAQVAMIASQQYTGRQFGGNISKNRPYLVGEAGPELMVPSGSGTMVPNRGLNSDKPVNVNFTINAVDATGIDQLLIQRKAMITGFIRDATENQGNRSFV